MNQQAGAEAVFISNIAEYVASTSQSPLVPQGLNKGQKQAYQLAALDTDFKQDSTLISLQVTDIEEPKERDRLF